MPHVCFVLPGPALRPGGGHKVVYQYANALAEAGCEVTVLHLRPERAESSSLRSAARAVAYRAGRRWRPRWFDLHPSVRVENFSSQAARHVPADVDVLIATSVMTAHFVASVAATRTIRGLYLIQHFEDWSAPAQFVVETWRLPLELVVVSGWLLRRADDLGLSARLIRNGIDTGEFPAGGDVTGRAPSVLALVAGQPWKRTDVVVDVFGRVASERPDVALAAFGTCRRPDGLPERVRYVRDPSREVLSQLYRESQVYLCASDYEGFGLPVAEAMASGAAVVSTDNGGVPDFAGAAAVYAPPGDAPGLASAVLRLLDDTDALRQLAARGREVIDGMTLAASAAEFVRVCVGDVRER
ncbi:glycosyltransferase family 4 protein [Nocardioides maradonensis]